jgi:hypothetical protein
MRTTVPLTESDIKWDKRFLLLARHVAGWSKDPSTQCGAVIVQPATRKIIQIAVDATSETYSGSVFALCSDGSLWSRQDLTGKSWERQPDIPQGPTQ